MSTKQLQTTFKIQDSIEIKIEEEFHPAGKSKMMGVEQSWNNYTILSFKLEGDILKRYIASMFKLAKETEGDYHDFHMSDAGLACWHSTPARTDYDDEQDCGAFVRYMDISYKGKVYEVEGGRSGQDMTFITLYAARQESETEPVDTYIENRDIAVTQQ